MKLRTQQQISDFFELNSELVKIKGSIIKVCEILLNVYQQGGKVLICGNGGSCADADHIVGELMKGFLLQRPLQEVIKSKFRTQFGEEGDYIAQKLQGSLPAISLGAHGALISAFSNDVDAELIYAQQVMGYARLGDAVIGISTSGNARNIASALMTAKVLGVTSVGLTGRDGGEIAKIGEYNIIVPKEETYRIQEYHLIIYHFICAYVESEIFEL